MSTKKKNVGRVPLRECVCCGSKNAKGDMTRIVISGRNTEVEGVVKDDTGKQKGRGAYICKRNKCIEKALEDGIIDSATYELCMEECTRYKKGLIPIAMKAGKLAAGEYQCEESIQKLEAYFVIIAQDASDNTKKKFEDKCKYRDIPFVIFGNKEELGGLIGKAERSVIAIKDENLGNQFIYRFGGNE